MPDTNWMKEFSRLDALWIHNDNPKRPHALLTSGKHSSGFFNATKVIENPCVMQSACTDLSRKILDQLTLRLRVEYPQAVVGSAFGAITIAHECAKKMSAKMAFTQKVDGGMALTRFSVEADESVLPVEDVMTTGNTTLKTIDALEKAGANVLPFVGVLVNRSGSNMLGDRKIISLIEHPMPTWEADDCPLCKKGSGALRPKEHWAELTDLS